MRYELKSIGIWPFIKVVFFLNLVFGFLFGVFYAIILVPIMSAVSSMTGFESPGMDQMPSIGSLLIIMPIMFALFSAVFNTILALIVAAVYNGIARLLGGFEFNFDALVEAAPVHATHAAGPQASYLAQAPSPTAPPEAPSPPPPPPQFHQPAPPPSSQPGTQFGTVSESRIAGEEPDEDPPRSDQT